MNTDARQDAEASRLERLWAGDFGDAYVDRNANAAKGREVFWRGLVAKHGIKSALEFGCNLGGNLVWLADLLGTKRTYGIDISETALKQLQKNIPGVNMAWSPAREVPYRDRWFDLTFTAGVLIHQPESTLPLVMNEIVRCSSRYVLAMEYFSESTVEVPYRGQEGALFKRNYGKLYQELFPELKLIETGHLDMSQGWDDITWWLFERA